MVLAIVLVLIVVGAVAFHLWSPWWFTPLASNWGQIDTMLVVTIALTGVVFVAINLLIAYEVVRFRRRKQHTASHVHENSKLEWTLIVLTSIGVVALLAPGLFVYSEFVSPPPNAIVLEAVGQQWQWSFRLPGADGQLGRTNVRFIGTHNWFGIDPNDPYGQDDILVEDSEIHLPLGVPVKVLLRSKDVLHDFYVPQFRVKMDIVPGSVSSLWFTPTRTGTFDLVCAEYCGLGHYAMNGKVVVEPPEAYQAWLSTNKDFAHELAEGGATANTEKTSDDILIETGEHLAQAKGCLGCHTTDGRKSVGPTWQGLYGKQETLGDGTQVTADDAYIKESIVDPAAKVVKGFPPAMPAFSQLTDEELKALLRYIQTLSGSPKDK